MEAVSAALVKKFWIVALFVPCTVYLLTANGLYSSDYPSSILGMQFAMWANHSFSLGRENHLVATSVDPSSYDGLFYSAVSPGFAILSYPAAALGFVIDGGSTLNVWGYGMLFDEFFLAATSSLAVLFTYRIARFYASPAPSLLASLTLAFASLPSGPRRRSYSSKERRSCSLPSPSTFFFGS
jgi:hypothetical protein